MLVDAPRCWDTEPEERVRLVLFEVLHAIDRDEEDSERFSCVLKITLVRPLFIQLLLLTLISWFFVKILLSNNCACDKIIGHSQFIFKDFLIIYFLLQLPFISVIKKLQY